MYNRKQTKSRVRKKPMFTYKESILNIKKGQIFLMNQLPKHVIAEIETNILLKKYSNEFLLKLTRMGFKVSAEDLK